MKIIPIAWMPLLLSTCYSYEEKSTVSSSVIKDCISSNATTLGGITAPEGFERVKVVDQSFGAWIRKLPLKKESRLFLYDGTLRPNQSGHYAILDLPIGNKNLQQCADAVIRLRAQYLFDHKRHDEIVFRDNNKKIYSWSGENNQGAFDRYLEKVFGMCGSASLEKQLKAVSDVNQLQIGDVWIKGGFPGHAMLVADMVINKDGKKRFLLLQGYMPAQDLHIVKNPDKDRSPWYEVPASGGLITPGWTFFRNQLRRW